MGVIPTPDRGTPKYEGLEGQGRDSGSGTKSGECLNCIWADCTKKTTQLTVVKGLPENLKLIQFLQKWAQVEGPRLGRKEQMLMLPCGTK